MNYSGEAAEQVVRMSLNGVEVAAKISGKAAERLAVLLYAVLREQKKTRGKMEENDILTVNDLLLGSAYIPRESILYLATGNVVEGKAWK